MNHQGKANQRHRVNRVINYVADNRSQPLSLEELADVACLSRFHFNRVFSEMCQETPMAYVSRTRLEWAASKLIFAPERSVTDISLASGFSSSEALSHAFKRRYGLGPRKFRKSNLWGVRDIPQNQIDAYPMLDKAAIFHGAVSPWRVSLREIPEMRLAYVRHRGPYFNLATPQAPSATMGFAFDRLISWAAEKGLWRADSAIYGLCPNNPSLTPPQYCHYDVCIPVDDSIAQDDVISIRLWPAMTVATLEVIGDSTQLMQAWQWLIDTWIPDNGYSMRNQSAFEVCQAENFRLRGPDEGITLCMPVQRSHTGVKST